MARPSTPARQDTRALILDAGERLIQERGYNGFSYQDIAEQLHIRKASIHYHFASKAELGAAVMQRYRERMEVAMSAARDEIVASHKGNPWRLLELYFAPYVQFAGTPQKICVCGALAGEYPALPAGMQAEVERFIRDHQAWLADLLRTGADTGDFDLSGNPEDTAKAVFNSLQGGLMMKRATGDMQQLTDVIENIKNMLRGKRSGAA